MTTQIPKVFVYIALDTYTTTAELDEGANAGRVPIRFVPNSRIFDWKRNLWVLLQ